MIDLTTNNLLAVLQAARIYRRIAEAEAGLDGASQFEAIRAYVRNR